MKQLNLYNIVIIFCDKCKKEIFGNSTAYGKFDYHPRCLLSVIKGRKK